MHKKIKKIYTALILVGYGIIRLGNLMCMEDDGLQLPREMAKAK